MAAPKEIGCGGDEYTTPEDAPEDRRTGVAPCPADYRCVRGVRYHIGSGCDRGKTPDLSDDTGRTCLPCPLGHFCVGGASPPIPCPEGHFTYMSDATSSNDCFKCPMHFICNPKGQPGATGIDDNWWAPPQNITPSSEAIECLNDDACLPDTVGTDVRCRATKGYTGRLCGICCRNEDAKKATAAAAAAAGGGGENGDGEAIAVCAGDGVRAENYARVLRRCRKCPKQELRLPGVIFAGLLGYAFLLVKTGKRGERGASAAMWRMMISPSKVRGTPDYNESAALHSYGLGSHCRAVLRG